MTAFGIAGWGIAGVALAAALHLAATKTSLLQVRQEGLGPPAALELITGLVFAVFAWRFGTSFDLLLYSWLAAIGILLSVIDLKTQLLPNKIIWLGAAILLAFLAARVTVSHDAWPLVRSILGALAALTFYGILYVLQPGQIGGGDVKLGTLIGLALTWLSWSALFTGAFIAWFAAGLTWAILRTTGRRTPNSLLPLGPFLVLGAFLAAIMIPG